MTKTFPKLRQQIQKIFEDALWKTNSSHKPRFTTYIVNSQIEDLEKDVLATLQGWSEKLEEIIEEMPTNYEICCFKCGFEFEGYTEHTEFCPICHFTKCPECEACRCSLSVEEAKIVDALWQTSGELILWWAKLLNKGKSFEELLESIK